MTSQTDTQQDEIDEAVAEAIEAALAVCESDEGVQPETVLTDVFMEHLKPVLAAIRRHAAADALRRKAKSLDNTARMFRDMSAARDRKGDNMSATIYASHATQARTDADALRKEADGIIAEGYEYECQECDTPVPDAGDLCEQHDVDPEDRWAE